MENQEKVFYPGLRGKEVTITQVNNEDILQKSSSTFDINRSVQTDEPYVYLTGVITFD